MTNRWQEYYDNLPNDRVELVAMKNALIGRNQALKQVKEPTPRESTTIRHNSARLRAIDSKIAEVNAMNVSISDKFVDAAREMLDAETFYEILDHARNL